MWSYIFFEYFVIFEIIVMNLDKKIEIMEDLVRFSKSKEFYLRIGKVWKRGYLLFGFFGIGKFIMIVVMVNLLKYDVYDFELIVVRDNIELRRFLIEIISKLIIVIEDIDCLFDLIG